MTAGLARGGPQFVVTLSCADRPGIVAAVSSLLAEAGCNILDSQQFGDPHSARFFMRVHAEAMESSLTASDLRAAFEGVASTFGMEWQLNDLARRPRVLIMVS